MRIAKAKPCPFCGSHDSFVENLNVCAGYRMCNDCFAKGPIVEHGDYDGCGDERLERDATRKWNKRRRAPSPPDDEARG